MADREYSLAKVSVIVAIITLALSIPATVLTTLQINDRSKGDGPQFIINTQQGPFQVPNGTMTQVDFMVIDQPETTEKTPESAVQYKLDELKSFAVIKFKNTGNLPASKVRLKTGTKGYARIEWDDGKLTDTHFFQDVTCGAVDIEKTIAISLWTVDELTTSTEMSLVQETGSIQ